MTTARSLARSSVVRVAAMFIQMAVGVFLLRFYVDTLGERWYGIWVITSSVAQQYYLLDFGLVTASSRYVALYLGKGSEDEVNEVISTSFVIYGAIAAAVLLVSGVIALSAGLFIEDQEAVGLVKAVIIVQGISMAIDYLMNAIAGVSRAFLRYDLIMYAHIGRLLLRTGVIVLFLSNGYGILAVAVISLIFNQFYNAAILAISKHLFPGLSVRWKLVRRERVKDLFGYSVWSFIAGLGDRLRLNIDAFVVGGFARAAMVPHYVVGNRMAEYMSTVVYNATEMTTPVFTKYYARGDFGQIRSKLKFLTKLNAVLATFGSGMIVLLGASLIEIWMGRQFLDGYPVLQVLAVAFVFETIHRPSKQVMYAVAKHRFYAVANILEGGANLLLSIALISRYGLVGVAFGTLIPTALNRGLIQPLYTTRVCKMRLAEFYGWLAPTFIVAGLFLGACHLTIRAIAPQPGLIEMAVISAVAALVYGPLAFLLLFSREERGLMTDLLPPAIRKHVSRVAG